MANFLKVTVAGNMARDEHERYLNIEELQQFYASSDGAHTYAHLTDGDLLILSHPIERFLEILQNAAWSMTRVG